MTKNKYIVSLIDQPVEYLLPDAIYKYRIWGDINTDRIIKNKELYLASPGIFKDGYNECKLEERYDLVTQELLFEKIKQDTKQEFSWMPEKDVELRAKKRLNDCKFYDKLNRAEVEKWTNKFQDDYLGLFCASLSKNSVEMWDKFGDLHQGYSVGLIPSELIKNPNLNGTFGKVDYYLEQNPPEIIPITLSRDDAVYNATLKNFSVPDDFKYENEYRIAKYKYIYIEKTDQFVQMKYTQMSRRVPIQEKCFKEILLGADISCKDRIEIIETCKINLPNIPIYQSNFNEVKRELTFNLI